MTEDERTREELLAQIEHLTEAEERFRSLAEYAPFPIVVIGEDLKVKYVNRLMPGFKEGDVIGRSIFDNITAEDPEEVKRTIKRVFETGKPGHFTIEGPSFEGGRSTYHTTVSPILKDGRVVAVTNVARDISKETQAAEALRPTPPSRVSSSTTTD
jgi:PAS domain S-box-containing protein